jgi:four helix bundle protein
MAVKDYRELIVWQKAMDLVEHIYYYTRGFPKEEVYGLSSQLRRAAISIPSNIAEGNARTTTRDFLHFLSIAYGSIKEAETQILIAERLGYDLQKQTPQLMEFTQEVARLICGLSNSLKRKLPT